MLNFYMKRENLYSFEVECEITWKNRNWEILTRSQFTPTHRTFDQVLTRMSGTKWPLLGCRPREGYYHCCSILLLRNFHPKKIRLKLLEANEWTLSMWRNTFGSGKMVKENQKKKKNNNNKKTTVPVAKMWQASYTNAILSLQPLKD